MKSIIFIVNVDWFFKSHRLPLALEAIKRNYKVIIITEDTGFFKYFKDLGFVCHNLKFGRGFGSPVVELLNFIKLYRIIRIYNADVIHNITLKPYLYGSFIAKIQNKKGVIVNSITGLGYLYTNTKQLFLSGLIKKLLWFALRNNEKLHFIFQNSSDMTFFQNIIHIPTKNFSIIKGAGVDENVFKRETLVHTDNNLIKIVLVARMLRDKGVFEFINAAKLLRDDLYGKAEFILVGAIDEFNPSKISEFELKELLEDSYITWIGHTSHIKEIYDSCDIACLPSYREGLPKSLVEAMAMSCPIVTTDTPGCNDCVEHGKNGFLVPVGDYESLANRILILCQSQELRVEMGKASRLKMIDEMSLNKVIDATFKTYEG
ncbi:MAG: glycosyltransferase family 4 protein [Chitinophagaceae bacterium]